MSESIPFNPAILRWARQSLELEIEEVAVRMNKKPADIEAWENGSSSPTYIQLEKLAYQVYKRPLALFFFPDPPEEEQPENMFRTLPETELDRIPARIRLLIRKALSLQLNLAELFDGRNPAQRNILLSLDFSPATPADEIATSVRNYLQVDFDEQFSWRSPDKALKRWREALEDNGIFIFKDSFNPPGRRRPDFQESPFSGFCLYDRSFPVIYVNNNKAKSRQIFTLFHELAHLLMHTGGVDTRQDDYIEELSGDDRRVEILCNRFAAEFLVPSSDFATRSKHANTSDEDISKLADHYSVSREVILRRFRDLGQVSQQEYERRVDTWEDELDRHKRSSGSSGGNPYATKGAYLGER